MIGTLNGVDDTKIIQAKISLIAILAGTSPEGQRSSNYKSNNVPITLPIKLSIRESQIVVWQPNPRCTHPNQGNTKSLAPINI
jgi:hypothetical protein